jgi:hypothetical protein
MKQQIERQLAEVGRFVRLGEAVTIDLTRKMLKVLPFSQAERIVEIPNADTPSEEALEARCKSF